MIAGHRSTEPGHIAALSHLGLEPILDLGMRLGEASGALACLPILDLAAAMISEMATLNELDVS
jgi:nicotinate-nucleotide--dimethylbenzimidazole phosphoribosyltransferase